MFPAAKVKALNPCSSVRRGFVPRIPFLVLLFSVLVASDREVVGCELMPCISPIQELG